MKKLQYYYKNLPKTYASVSKDDFVISDKKLNDLTDKIKSLPDKAISLYMQNGCSLLVNQTFDPINYFGIDFIAYFNSTFDKDVSDVELPSDADVVVVYNIGLEKAMNTSFSARLLKGVMKRIKDSGKHCFLCSDLSYTNFYKQYEIEIVNKITIKEKEEERIF